MMAFICVLVSILMMLLVFKGQSLRKYNLVAGKTEDGLKLMAQDHNEDISHGANGSESSSAQPKQA